MGHNDPGRRVAIATSIRENEVSLDETAWDISKQLQDHVSNFVVEDHELFMEVRHIHKGLVRQYKTPYAWWQEQNQTSRFSQKMYKMLCDMWANDH